MQFINNSILKKSEVLSNLLEIQIILVVFIQYHLILKIKKEIFIRLYSKILCLGAYERFKRKNIDNITLFLKIKFSELDSELILKMMQEIIK